MKKFLLKQLNKNLNIIVLFVYAVLCLFLFFQGWPPTLDDWKIKNTAHAATVYGPYTFDSDNDSDEDAWTFVSDNGTNGLNPANTARAWSEALL